jgi:hypothetical protein
LASDICNYLTGEPLKARPATTGYFLRRRLMKYRRQLAISGLVIGTMILTLLAMAG